LMMASTTIWMGFWSVSRWTMSKACSTMRTCSQGRKTAAAAQQQHAGQWQGRESDSASSSGNTGPCQKHAPPEGGTNKEGT
jgi:hypothetical protein